MEQLCQHLFIGRRKIEDADFTFETADIFDDFISLRFTEGEVIPVFTKFADQVGKGIDSKGIMLCGYGEACFMHGRVQIFFFQQGSLCQYLSRIGKKFISFIGNDCAFPVPVENDDMHFFFQFMDCLREAWLRNEKSSGCLCEAAFVCDRNCVSELL